MTEMTERERIARLIDPDAWEWLDGLGDIQKAYVVRLVEDGDAQEFGRGDRANRSFEAADRLIAAGLTLRDASVAVPVYESTKKPAEPKPDGS